MTACSIFFWLWPFWSRHTGAAAAAAIAAIAAAAAFLFLLLREEAEKTITKFRTQLYWLFESKNFMNEENFFLCRYCDQDVCV
ncbi:hypothetical protein DERF_008352 [Dermatophagoides farinae]|uniref:Uncharacterized protein n=1 Tax=Dermatophagoides farinae TaxID=6954 RepID=A0A922I495_DERFA|nr:hypothetical protein DERF_008352 [Dermatophagoides farinae]